MDLPGLARVYQTLWGWLALCPSPFTRHICSAPSFSLQ